ncbi:hypothetical protein CAP35_08605 [Chitinophagaceae bacterium IBVUCB1]|nr:hypothetical protein CAP35_08605 [Chitinophagaceae bacterium IBVUCB1]
MLFRYIALLVLVSFFYIPSRAQDTILPDNSHLQVSLLTCGTGEEIYETFGHTAIRIVDSVAGTDMVYNYGTFDGYAENFELQFMRGKLLYYVTCYPYSIFVKEYEDYNRSIEEQVLQVSGGAKQSISHYLKNNALDENKYYKYDFFFDNCATRIRDVFRYALGVKFQYANVLPKEGNITFRQIINRYFYRTHGERVGVNLLLGSRIDKPMTNLDIMFLPDYLRDGLAGATLKGNPVVAKTQQVLGGSSHKPAGFNWVLALTIAIGLFTIIGLIIPAIKPVGRVMQFMVLFITGLLGCLMLVMWFATDHQGCQNNYNILWALPTNIIIAFAGKRNKSRYAIIGILLIFISLALHVFKVQELALLELSPILLSLLFIYGSMYRKSKIPA